MIPPEGYVTARSLASGIGLGNENRILLGFSGGPDSSALLALLAGEEYEVIPVHINHMIRGEEAERDEAFCRETVKKYGFGGVFVRRDIPEEARASGEGLEAAARRARYEVFSALMKEKDVKLLATAHNARDNLETLILNVVRGTGPKGACGIPQTRPCPPGFVVRPLLRTERDDVIAFCRDRGIEYVTDSSNFDDRYSRNRIRLKVLPELYALNPGAAGAAARFCEAVSRDSELLDKLAEKELNSRRTESGEIDLSGLDLPIAARIIAKAAHEAGANPEFLHVDRLAQAALTGEKADATLPGGIIASMRKSRLSLRKDTREKKKRYNGPEPEKEE